MEVDGDGKSAGTGNGSNVETPSAVGAQLPPHLQDRHDYLTSDADMNFNVRGSRQLAHGEQSDVFATLLRRHVYRFSLLCLFHYTKKRT